MWSERKHGLSTEQVPVSAMLGARRTERTYRRGARRPWHDLSTFSLSTSLGTESHRCFGPIGPLRKRQPATGRLETEFFIDNLLVRIHCNIVMIRRTGLAPWDVEFPFPGSLTSSFLAGTDRPASGLMDPPRGRQARFRCDRNAD